MCATLRQRHRVCLSSVCAPMLPHMKQTHRKVHCSKIIDLETTTHTTQLHAQGPTALHIQGWDGWYMLPSTC